MSFFDDSLVAETAAAVRARIVGYAQAADLAISNWIVGGVGEQIVAGMTLAGFVVAKAVPKIVRGYVSLDTSTDPGDPDPFDPANEDLEPAPGFLSNKGKNDFGTPRREATFATGFFTFDNTAGIVARNFAPETLTFTWTEGSPPSPPPTYRNAPDPDIYTEPGGTVTVAAGASLEIPIVAEEIGTRSNAPAGDITLTTTLSGVTGTNAAPVTATDREGAVAYRNRCRQALDRVALGGPSGAYEYLANTNLDGTPLQNASDNDVNINRVQVSQDSATGIVDAWFAAPPGAPSGEDVTAANDNIEAEAFAVPDAITYTGLAATELQIAIAGTAKMKAAPGRSVADAKEAIVDALVDAFTAYAIGGVDQVAGAGVLYTHDFQAVAAAAYPGLYDLLVTTPAGASTALAQGVVGVVVTTTGDWTVTEVA